MCIAIYKPMGTDFPSKKTLQTCFDNNPHGAGFMVATGNTVEIHKGYMGFRSFWKALRSARQKYGDEKAFVMHFRISTQGGIRADGCHPFPLSGNMDDMRLLDAECEIGIAHNGIIDLCTTWKRNVDYSDTMAFITEYLSLIIKDESYCKDDSTMQLITKLCGSRLAILDKSGHCELIGDGWTMCNGVWYSNGSYKKDSYKATKTTTYYPTLTDWGYKTPTWYSEWDVEDEAVTEMYDYYDEFLDEDGYYDFTIGICPELELGDASYCELCKRYMKCYGESEETA